MKKRRQYRRCNGFGTLLSVRLTESDDGTNPVRNYVASVNELLRNVLKNSRTSDMVGIAIRNEVNRNDKAIGISFGRKDQISVEVIWRVFENGGSVQIQIQRFGQIGNRSKIREDVCGVPCN